jgi:hypothetical protein
LGDAFEAFHGALALRSALGGLVLVAVWRLFRHPDEGGRLGWVASIASALAWREHIWTASLAVATAVAAPVLPAVVRWPDSPLVGPMAAISLVGVWAAVPDTEPALVAAAVAVVAVALGPIRSARVGDRFVALGAVALTSWTGSAGRSEIVGGLACAGLLLAPTPDDDRWATVAAHVGAVLVASRVLTRWSWTGAAIGGSVLVVASWAWWWARSGRSGRDPEDA